MLLNDFIELVENELSLEKNELNASTEFRSIRTWSSLNALVLLARIHEETAKLLTASDLASCTTIEDIHKQISA